MPLSTNVNDLAARAGSEIKAVRASQVTSVSHGADANAARPTGFAMVIWSGTVDPVNAIAPDIINRTDLVGGGGGGAVDPWTYVKLAADEVSTSTSNVATALRFAPEADKLYEVEATLFMRSTVTTTGVRPGIDWPDSNVSQNVAWIMAGQSATAFVSRIVGNLTTVNAASTAVAVANEGIYGHMRASFVTSGVPSSDFIVTLASEIAASEVRLAANSWLKYRVI